jgi:prepilin-type processing-associated H-X9-DG protein
MGNTDIDQTSPYQGVTFRGAPFDDIGAPYAQQSSGQNAGVGGIMSVINGVTGFQAITDGLSNTLMTSELIIGQGGDLRGYGWWANGALFTAWYAPNTSSPDYMPSPSYCKTVPSTNPPCVGQTATSGIIVSARSFHAGGVHAGMCDGSVRFIKNSIGLTVWRALSTTAGGEIISADAF